MRMHKSSAVSQGGPGGKSCLQPGNATIFFIDRQQQEQGSGGGGGGGEVGWDREVFIFLFIYVVVQLFSCKPDTMTLIWSDPIVTLSAWVRLTLEAGKKLPVSYFLYLPSSLLISSQVSSTHKLHILSYVKELYWPWIMQSAIINNNPKMSRPNVQYFLIHSRFCLHL